MLAAFDREAVQAQDALTIIQGVVPTLRRRGNRMTGLCPFHSEKTPSFSFDPQKKLFYCFGCGRGGDVFNFIMQVRGVDFVGAAKAAGAWKKITPAEGDRLWRERRDALAQRRRRDCVEAQARALFLQVR